MKRLAAALMIALTSATFIHADVPSADPKQRTEAYALRTLVTVIREITELDAIVIVDGPDKGKLTTQKAELQAKIQTQINDLNTGARYTFETQAAAQEASLDAQIKDAKDPAVKSDLEKKVKPYKTLRDRFLQASIDGGDTLAEHDSERKSPLVFGGIALALAFASGGLIVARRNNGAK
jgi:hypothetical protein